MEAAGNILWQRFFLLSVLSFLLNACSEVPVKSVAEYKLADREAFYGLESWAFEGRLALSDGKESWNASIEWKHSQEKDDLKLSGPLGQGAVAIALTKDSVTIDRGDDEVLQSNRVDEFVESQLGIFVPVRALRYWVLGLTAPDKTYVELTDGFEQEKWLIQYQQMQQVGEKGWMPRKLKAWQDKTLLKLIIDDWKL